MQTFYKFKHYDINVGKNSSSGGAFTMISDRILESGGVVYGCVLNEKFNAIHIRAERKEQRDKMRGSKYIQSNISAAFQQIAVDLANKRKVLFSGTPCQVNAIINYLKIKKICMDNFFSVEVICHGVGSEKFFHDYIKDKEKKYHSKAVNVKFRAKYRVGQKQDMAIIFENDKEYHAASTNLDWFFSVYLKNLILRPSCYECKYAQEHRVSDISVADLWKENEIGDWSLVICNTKKGKTLLNGNDCGELMVINKSEVYQPHMKSPCNVPSNRKIFWQIYLKKGYKEVQRYIGNNTLKSKTKYVFAHMLRISHADKWVKKIRR